MEQRQSPLVELLQAAVALAAVALMAWEETPPWQRQLIKGRAMAVARRVLAVAARKSGHLAMSDELRGRYTAAVTRYEVTRRLSELRDRLSK